MDILSSTEVQPISVKKEVETSVNFLSASLPRLLTNYHPEIAGRMSDNITSQANKEFTGVKCVLSEESGNVTAVIKVPERGEVNFDYSEILPEAGNDIKSNQHAIDSRRVLPLGYLYNALAAEMERLVKQSPDEPLNQQYFDDLSATLNNLHVLFRYHQDLDKVVDENSEQIRKWRLEFLGGVDRQQVASYKDQLEQERQVRQEAEERIRQADQRVEDAETKARQAEEKTGSADKRVKAAEGRVDKAENEAREAQKQVEKAEARAQAAETAMRKAANRAQAEVEELTRDKKSLQKKLRKAEERANTAEKKKRAAETARAKAFEEGKQAGIEEAGAKMEQERARASEELESRAEITSEKLAELEEEVAKLKEEGRPEDRERIEKLETQLEEANRRVQKEGETRAQLLHAVKEGDPDLCPDNETRVALQERIDRAKAEGRNVALAEQTVVLAAKDQELAAVKEELSGTRSALEAAQRELATRPQIADVDALRDQINDLQAELKEAKAARNTAQQELASRPTAEEVENLNAQITDLNRQLEQAKTQLESRPTDDQVRTLQQQIEELKQTRDQEVAQRQKVEAEKAGLEAKLGGKEKEVATLGQNLEKAKAERDGRADITPSELKRLNQRVEGLQRQLKEAEDSRDSRAEISPNELEKLRQKLNELEISGRSQDIERIKELEAEVASSVQQRLDEVQRSNVDESRVSADVYSARAYLNETLNLILQGKSLTNLSPTAYQSIQSILGHQGLVALNELATRPTLTTEQQNRLSQLPVFIEALRTIVEKGVLPADINLQGELMSIVEAIQKRLATTHSEGAAIVEETGLVATVKPLRDMLIALRQPIMVGQEQFSFEEIVEKLNAHDFLKRPDVLLEVLLRSGLDLTEFKEYPDPFDDLEPWRKALVRHIRVLNKVVHPDVQSEIAESLDKENLDRLQRLATWLVNKSDQSNDRTLFLIAARIKKKS